MPATIFAGSKVKALKSTLNLNGGADVISSATDPTSVAVDAAIGSLLLNTTSGKLYKKLDAGSSTNWQEVGAGTGGKNYITKGSFDTASTSGWSLAASTLDATTKLPNQASGSWTAAAGTLSITTVGGGSQLSLLPYSLSLVSSAATTAGNMLVSDALALDLEAQSSIQTFSFFYKVASGSPTLAGNSTNSIAVAVYDVTNGAWIDPAGRYNVVQLSGVAKCAGTFQVPSNCTSVRLAVYFPNASAGAITVYLDDFYLGPQVVQYGAPVTDWQAYTPTFTGIGTVTSIEFEWRRVGDHMQIRGKFTAGTPTSVEARLSLPSGLVAAGTDKIPTIQAVGQMYCANATNQFVTLQEPSVSYITFGVQSGSTNPLSKNLGTLFASGVVYNILAEMPVQGWSSSVQMSNDTDTRVVAARAHLSGVQSINNGATEKINLGTVGFDTHSCFDLTNDRYVVAVPGIYDISGAASLAAAGSGRIIAEIRVNGSTRATIRSAGNSVGNDSALVTTKESLVAGDYIELFCTNDTGASASLEAASTATYLAVSRISGPSAIAASETVAVAYWASANGTSSTTAAVNFDSKEYDTHGAVTTGANWKFTAPISGLYTVSAYVNQSVAANCYYNIYKNSTTTAYKTVAYSNLNVGLAQGSTTIRLNAGDYIGIYSSVSNIYAGNASVSNQASSAVCITKVGN